MTRDSRGGGRGHGGLVQAALLAVGTVVAAGSGLAVVASGSGLAVGCGGGGGPGPVEPSQDVNDAAVDEGAEGAVTAVLVRVLLDGLPAAGVIVSQGGSLRREVTGADGTVEYELDPAAPGEKRIIASHPEARVGSAEVPEGAEGAAPEVLIELTRYAKADNPEYEFLDPGEPGRRESTAQCGHCHVTLNDDWYGSVHRKAASNPNLWDLYQGTAAGFGDEVACAAAGGEWKPGKTPGHPEETTERCWIAAGGVKSTTGGTGGCADCHAPGIDGAAGGEGGGGEGEGGGGSGLGGRDLRDAVGFAYDFGVHCDVCHRVESVEVGEAAGVAGWLKLHRPSEPSPSLTLGAWFPLTFGPHHDSPNPKMGSVQRDHFGEAELCGGCHQLDQEVLVEGHAIDTERWPGGRLPVHSTFAEWEDGPMNPAAPCQSCHMPPAPEVSNGADLQDLTEGVIGIPGGWPRPPGTVRHHTWDGPRAKESRMLELAAAVEVTAAVAEGELVAEVTVRNVGPGHAIPTGEPMRSLVVVVEASCGGERLAAMGGDAVPDFGGALARKVAGEDWDVWPGAKPGDVVRVVRRPGGFHDYEGFGPFGDGTFDAEAKGMPIEEVSGSAAVTAVAEDGTVNFDGPLPEGDVAYLADGGDAGGAGLPEDGAPARAWAGAAGFAFARVLTGAAGERMVPHFLAVDVASDNRLLPGGAFTSTHRFAATCEEPDVRAVLVHRAFPLELARERGWALEERVMAEGRVSRGATKPADPDPPPGETVEVELVAAPRSFDAAGVAVDGYAYNGQVPGPEIRAEVGDVLVVHLENQLDAATSIHWHGLEVPWAMDGAEWLQDPVPPGGAATYTFPLRRPGTFWYHPHFDSDRQVDLGLYGALVVEDPAALPPTQAVDRDVVLVFDAWDEAPRHEDDPAREDALHDHVIPWPPALWTVNGEAAPALSFPAGDLVRARLLNASTGATLSLSWPGIEVVARDQGPLSVSEWPDRLVLASGDRAEVLFRPAAAGFDVLAHPFTIHGGEATGPAAKLFRVERTGSFESAAGDPTLAPEGEPPTPDPGWTDVVWVFTGSDHGGKWLVNGEEFPEVTVEALPLGLEAVIEVRNLSPSNHPFHLHGHRFEVLSVNGAAPAQRRFEDTIDVGVRQTVRLLLHAWNPGEWMAHCHILPHAHDGMMTVLRVGDGVP